jgi:hypothetical protein
LCQHLQCGCAAALWFEFVVEGICEYHAPDPVAVNYRPPGCKTGKFRRKHVFEDAAGSKKHSGPIIHEAENRPFALFAKNLCVGFSGTRHDPPVQVPHVIAALIWA